ncbi:MAG: hypothetical protein ABEH38_07795 [Flavobacteriales bacterium]
MPSFLRKLVLLPFLFLLLGSTGSKAQVRVDSLYDYSLFFQPSMQVGDPWGPAPSWKKAGLFSYGMEFRRDFSLGKLGSGISVTLAFGADRLRSSGSFPFLAPSLAYFRTMPYLVYQGSLRFRIGLSYRSMSEDLPGLIPFMEPGPNLLGPHLWVDYVKHFSEHLSFSVTPHAAAYLNSSDIKDAYAGSYGFYGLSVGLVYFIGDLKPYKRDAS